VISSIILCNIPRQLKEEAGSAGEQPASNGVDAYTEKGVEHFDVQPLLFLVSKMAKKTHFTCRQAGLSLYKYTYHFMKLIRCSRVDPRCKSR
jgi:hypothetical protein